MKNEAADERRAHNRESVLDGARGVDACFGLVWLVARVRVRGR